MRLLSVESDRRGLDKKQGGKSLKASQDKEYTLKSKNRSSAKGFHINNLNERHVQVIYAQPLSRKLIHC